MSEELTIYEASRALAETDRGNYSITCGTVPLSLKRGVDFDNPVNKKTGKKTFDKPILQKPGAEKIAFGFGLLQQYTIESKIEQANGDSRFFMYTVRCDLVKLLPSGQCVVVANYYGSANTAEKRNGFNAPADAANGTLKMAQKRALVGAALAISGLSDLFYQDIDNDVFMDNASTITKAKDDDPISSKMIQRIYAMAGSMGITTPEAKNIIISLGFASTKDIKMKDYDAVCKAIEAHAAGGQQKGE